MSCFNIGKIISQRRKERKSEDNFKDFYFTVEKKDNVGHAHKMMSHEDKKKLITGPLLPLTASSLSYLPRSSKRASVESWLNSVEEIPFLDDLDNETVSDFDINSLLNTQFPHLYIRQNVKCVEPVPIQKQTTIHYASTDILALHGMSSGNFILNSKEKNSEDSGLASEISCYSSCGGKRKNENIGIHESCDNY